MGPITPADRTLLCPATGLSLQAIVERIGHDEPLSPAERIEWQRLAVRD
ncbi:MAG: hypothetical protein ACO3B3_10470 [Cyanobium sp.]|jgi:hypothetical protein